MEVDESESSDPAERPAVGVLSSIRGKSLMGVQIEVTVSVGKSRQSLSELMKLQQDSVLQLDSRIEDPVDIYVGERLIARGELEEIEGDPGKLGVRLTEVANLSEGL